MTSPSVIISALVLSPCIASQLTLNTLRTFDELKVKTQRHMMEYRETIQQLALAKQQICAGSTWTRVLPHDWDHAELLSNWSNWLASVRTYFEQAQLPDLATLNINSYVPRLVEVLTQLASLHSQLWQVLACTAGTTDANQLQVIQNTLHQIDAATWVAAGNDTTGSETIFREQERVVTKALLAGGVLLPSNNNIPRSSTAPKAFSTGPNLLRQVEVLVQATMGHNDASHDWNHVQRVRSLALQLAAEENATLHQRHVIELAAMLHDLFDWKYPHHMSMLTVTDEPPLFATLRSMHCPEDLIEEVCVVVQNIGFKNSLNATTTTATTTTTSTLDATTSNIDMCAVPSSTNQPTMLSHLTLCIACVSDADMLDAMGAIGIARAFTYGGHKGQPLYTHGSSTDFHTIKTVDRTSYQSETHHKCTMQHFGEKLLKLKDMMRTPSGRRRAIDRHATMEQFVLQFEQELCATTSPNNVL